MITYLSVKATTLPSAKSLQVCTKFRNRDGGLTAKAMPKTMLPSPNRSSSGDEFGLRVLSEPWPITPDLGLESSIEPFFGRNGGLPSSRSLYRLLERETGRARRFPPRTQPGGSRPPGDIISRPGGKGPYQTWERIDPYETISWKLGLRSFWGSPLECRLLRYDLPSSSYRSYSRFIPFRCYDVPYSNSGDSRRSIALFTTMAIHLSLGVAPLDLQQGGNSRILYVHVPAARMSIIVYIATAINTFLFLLTKHPLYLRSSGTGIEMGAFFTLFTLVTGGFRGRPMWGTFWVWDARLTSVFISFLIYLGALRFQKLPVEPASISIRAGPIDIPIIKSSVNWWNTSHQPGSISQSGTSIHVPMPIPILSNFANFPFSTRILFVLETRLPIPSFLESPITEEIEAREGIPKPSSLACIHG
ncbi:unnamed protein product [Microthlaspi erraticum]|uniref:Cytochrome c assembly protein domain-containing protein n=1 Tax=Microthlaspi erraticum TaxID=1685480 RepID=A0A6D2JQL4_9BRAS|nr:unnamed protein product [Microthlaspi erraticum]